MSIFRVVFWIVLASGLVLNCPMVQAQSETEPDGEAIESQGKTDLEEAVELKADQEAGGLQHVTRIIDLLESALDKGLTKDDEEFASQLLVAALLERSEALSTLIFGVPQPDQRWPQIRNLAVRDLLRLLQLDDSQLKADLMLGRLLSLPGGNNERAMEAFSKVADSEDADAALKARALVYRGTIRDDEEAQLADYNRAVELAPEDAEIIRTRAMLHLRADRFEQALADIDRAIEVEPDHAPTHEVRGMALMMLDRFDDALKAFDRAVELDPEATSSLQNRGRVLALMGDFSKALEALKTAIDKNPQDYSALLLRAQIYAQQGNIEAAIDDVDTVLGAEPQLRPAVRFKSDLLAASDRMDAAINLMSSYLENTPGDLEMQLRLGTYLLMQRRSSQAISTLSKVIDATPENVAALRSRGDAYLNVGRHADAIADYERAIRLAEQDSGLLNNLAWVLATSPQDEVRSGERSVELATEACKLTEYSAPHILSTLAAGYAESGDFDTAIKWSTKAVELASQQGDGGIDEQLQSELESYRQKKPWRELMQEDQTPQANSKPAGDLEAAQTSDF